MDKIFSVLNKIFNLNYKENSFSWVNSGIAFRRLIGILGMLLPFLIWFWLAVDSGIYHPLESISHYYFTRASGIFTIIISLLAIFLIIYKGDRPGEFYLSLISGVFALCVVIFPTYNLCNKCLKFNNDFCITVVPVNAYRETFHHISAAIFLICLASMSFFQFTKQSDATMKEGSRKLVRNRIYRICAIIMVAALAVIFSGKYLKVFDEDFYYRNSLTFWMETIAVEAFGFSWFVKGKTIFRDV
jgi:hypothetical protein